MLTLDTQLLDFEDVYRVAVQNEMVKLGAHARQVTDKARHALEQAVANGQHIYGVNTGFGALKNHIIPTEDINALQQKLIMSHAVGVGRPLDATIVRGMLLIIANYLSKGSSGVRPIIIDTLIAILNKNVCPIVPEKGSVGSSGDLAPSAHIALVLIGKGVAIHEGETLSGAEALRRAGIKPVTLTSKEGLAPINNTACITATSALCMHNANRLAALADIAGALSAEALGSGDQAFHPAIHDLKPYAGQKLVAQHLRHLLANSTLVDPSRSQDQYSIRCMPQIHGGIREAINYVRVVVNTEINSVTDNPLVVTESDSQHIISGGNFHGEAIGLAMDTLGMALSEFANIADRRISSRHLCSACKYTITPGYATITLSKWSS